MSITGNRYISQYSKKQAKDEIIHIIYKKIKIIFLMKQNITCLI